MDAPCADAHLCPQTEPVAISESSAGIVEYTGTVYTAKELFSCILYMREKRGEKWGGGRGRGERREREREPLVQYFTIHRRSHTIHDCINSPSLSYLTIFGDDGLSV